ncbi:CIS tube protein [Dinghuibacter silviterrae]|uniref:LysM domain-containing protein n=1 Tax=Dinghuibacter silviterrae TaxID=1539049 RepID=A0A4R8DSR5_9BACT|nr:LysM peptidoglycan-binding domain-containing protein [Dinghuibacter silviterrae]TDX01280.1 hypothetical protein EDB95_2313 [Dinghuibacter silviterrae]
MTTSTLAKLKIQACSDPQGNSPTDSIDASINPDSYSLSYGVSYKGSQEKLSNAVTQIFQGMSDTSLSLDIVVDGTGLVPLPSGVSDVDGYLKKLKDIVYTYQGTYHRPNYLKITWGNLIFLGVCDSMSTKYTLFNPSGAALRATVSLKFKQNTDFETKLKLAQASSPDLTHVRTVKAGDTLPLMAYRIYGDSAYYTLVARANNLDHFASIRPGDELYFPPLTS